MGFRPIDSPPVKIHFSEMEMGAGHDLGNNRFSSQARKQTHCYRISALTLA